MMDQQTENPNKKMNKADWIGLIGGLFLAQLIYTIGDFGFIPALIIAFGSYWIIKKTYNYLFGKRNSEDHLQEASVNNKKQGSKKILIIIGVILLIGVLFFTLYSPNDYPSVKDTDKSPQNSVVENDLYRNTKYNFRIKFPEGWEQKDGDAPNIVRKAVNGDSTISIGIRDLSNNSDINNITIDDLYDDVDQYIEEIKLEVNNLNILKKELTYLDNKPVYHIQYQGSYKVLDLEVQGEVNSYQLLHKGISYTITTMTSIEPNRSMYDEFLMYKSVSSFVIEDY